MANDQRANGESTVSTAAGPAQEAVLKVLGEVLQRDDITPTDDFFLIGGHSLLMVRVVGKLKREHGLALDARQFGVNSQVAALIAACRPVADAG